VLKAQTAAQFDSQKAVDDTHVQSLEIERSDTHNLMSALILWATYRLRGAPVRAPPQACSSRSPHGPGPAARGLHGLFFFLPALSYTDLGAFSQCFGRDPAIYCIAVIWMGRMRLTIKRIQTSTTGLGGLEGGARRARKDSVDRSRKCVYI